MSIAVDRVAKLLYFPGLYEECRAFLSSMMGKFHVLAEIKCNMLINEIIGAGLLHSRRFRYASLVFLALGARRQHVCVVLGSPLHLVIFAACQGDLLNAFFTLFTNIVLGTHDFDMWYTAAPYVFKSGKADKLLS